MTGAAISVPAQLPAIGPYKGLANYTEEDAAFFFGRDREREIIIANLKARRLTLLYGESGVGKSSLLRAGVVADLLTLADENMEELGTPEYLPVVYSTWRDDPVAGLLDAIDGALERVTGRPAGLSASLGLEEAIQTAARAADAYLLIILDQFEEYFLYHPGDEESEPFADQFPRAVNRAGLQAGFLVATREDALAKLDRFKGEIPKLFDTFLRIDHLDAAAAHEAIVGPVEVYNRRAPEDGRVWIDPVLIDNVLNQVRTGQVVLEEAGQGTVAPAGPIAWADDRIETPYLQLVMARLWDEERRRGSLELRVATLDALGGAQEIVRTHLDAALSNFSLAERYVVADLFHHLVTPSGTKIAHEAGDLAEYVRRPEVEVAALLEKLAARDTRIVRAVAPPPGEDRSPRYEIFHDVLAPPVLDWRSRQTAARRAEEQRRAARAALRRRLFWLGGGAGLVLFGLIVWLAVQANSQRDAAQASARLSASLARKDSDLARVANAQRLTANQQRSRAIAADLAAKRAERLVRNENGRLTAQAAQLRLANQRAAALSGSLAIKAQALSGSLVVQAHQNGLLTRRGHQLAAANQRTAAVAQLNRELYGELVGVANVNVHNPTYRYLCSNAQCYTIYPNARPALPIGAVRHDLRAPNTVGPKPGGASYAYLDFLDFIVHAPAGSQVTVSCPPRACGRFTRGVFRTHTSSVSVPSLTGFPFAQDTRLTVFVVLPDIGRTIVLSVVSGHALGGPGTSVSQTGDTYCRPQGSRVSAAAIPGAC